MGLEVHKGMKMMTECFWYPFKRSITPSRSHTINIVELFKSHKLLTLVLFPNPYDFFPYLKH